MYFITEGFVGIGFSMAGFSNQKLNYVIGKKQAST